ncbi:MAG TPA: hypothetical protein VJ997_06540, partial [Longimicrobiales bacterium]|nr:hypothetical protein [Longimicrobiales bacterium]
MKTEVRFVLAIGLMLVVLVGTNLLFPPVVPDEVVQPDTAVTQTEPSSPSPGPGDDVVLPPSVGATAPGA